MSRLWIAVICNLDIHRLAQVPLYVKVVDCGNLPNTTSKEVAHGIANVAYMIDVTLQGLNASSFTHNANELTVWANYECVYIKTLNDLSRYSVYARDRKSTRLNSSHL